MKHKILLQIVLLHFASFSFAQWNAGTNTNWNYDFGTRTTPIQYTYPGTGTPAYYTSPSSGTPGTHYKGTFDAAPPSGIAGVAIHANSSAGMLTLNKDNSLTLLMGQTGSFVRFSASAIPEGVATSVVRHSFTVKFGTGETGQLQYAMGNSGPGSTNIFEPNSNTNIITTTSYNAIFTSLIMSFNTPSTNNTLALSYRKSSESAAASKTQISSYVFQKNTSYNLQFYFNNSGISQEYNGPENGTYTVPTGNMHIWKSEVDGTNTWTRVAISSSDANNFNIPRTTENGTNVIASQKPLNSFLFSAGNTVSATASSTATFTISDNQLAYLSNAPTTLPISLTSFKASAISDGAKLEWETASENNNAYFELERSEDGKNFIKFAAITSKGTSSKPTSYSYKDVSLSTETVYYRLKQVDHNGDFSYVGNTITFTIPSFKEKFSVFMSDDYTLKTILVTSKKSKCTFRIYNLAGEVILKSNENLVKGTNTRTYDVAGLPSGLYLVEIYTDGVKNVQKFVR